MGIYDTDSGSHGQGKNGSFGLCQGRSGNVSGKKIPFILDIYFYFIYRLI